MNGVCCYDGARLPVARFGNTVAMETTGGDEGSYRQSADGLWVNPFKHELPLSFLDYYLFLSPTLHPPPTLGVTPFYIQQRQKALNKILGAKKEQKVPVSTICSS